MSLNTQTSVETMILFAPQVLYGPTIALAHGPPEVHDSRKRYFFHTKIRFASLAAKIFKNNRGVFIRQLASISCQLLSMQWVIFGAAATLRLGIVR